MKMNRTISIIVPVYNAATYIPRLVETLSKQPVDDYEILFTNDRSPDDSGKVIRKLAAGDRRIKYFEHAENRGQGAARNTGLENATGQYVMYVDADDSFAPDYIEKMIAAIEKDHADVAVCNSVWQFPLLNEKKNMFFSEPDTEYRLLSGNETLRRYFNIYESDMWIPVEPWGKIVRRSFIEQNSIRHKETLFEDVVMTFNEVALAQKCAFIGDYLYYYNNKNENAATVERQRKYIREIYRVPEGIFEVVERYGLRDRLWEYATLFYFRYLHGAYSFFAKGGRFREELHYTLGKYRELLTFPEFGTMKPYVFEQVKGFAYEMKAYRFADLFSYFIAPHEQDLKELLVRRNGHLVIKEPRFLGVPLALVKRYAWLGRDHVLGGAAGMKRRVRESWRTLFGTSQPPGESENS